MEKPEVFICDCDHANVKQEAEVFGQAGIDYEWLQCKTQEEVIAKCQGAKAFLNQYVKMDEKIFKAIPTLKFIVRYGVGVDNVNLEDATRYGVQVCNVPDYGVNEVADQAFALMMALVRKTYLLGDLVRQGIWDYQKSIPIYRGNVQTVGVVGIGRIGSAFVKRAQAFGYRVVGNDIERNSTGRHFPEIEFVSFDELLEQSDIISLHCSLNETTQHLFNEENFRKMKRSPYFINVARGGIVDEKALDKALTEKWISGAGLDVVESESIGADHFLLKHKNIIVTPHMAWYSQESAIELKRKCAEEVTRFLTGEQVQYPINKL